MTARSFVLACALAFAVPAIGADAKDAEPLVADPALEARAMHVAGELRCLVCQNETLADSQADLAVDLRRQIRLQLADGRTEAQIVDHLVARYGEFVRYRPAWSATTALLWTGPFVLLLVAGGLLARTLARRRHDRRTDVHTGALGDAPNEPTSILPSRSQGAARHTGVLTAAAMVVFAGCVYAAIGNPAAIGVAPPPADASADAADASADASTNDLDAMLATVASRLATPSADPAADAQGWAMLGRSYAALQRFTQADRAFERALALAPADAALLIDRADVLGALQSGRMAGEPERLVARALALDPSNLKGLALAGTAAYERRDYASARRRWLAAQALAPPGSAFASALERSLADVPVAAAAPEAPARVSGRVELNPALARSVSPQDVVFITARAADGPRMPLAILRKRVADLPIDFVLDDSLAMSPAMRLSNTTRVVLTARISPSGEAVAQPGEPRADSAPVDIHAAGIQLTLSSPQP